MIVDIACAVVLLTLGIIGLFRGFMKQLLSLVGWLVALIGAFFLFKPVYELLSGFSFYNNMIENIGSGMNIDLAILRPIAEAAGKTQGVLVSEYVCKIVLFLLLTVILALLFKLVKAILIRIVELPGINVIDKLLGAALGLFWAALIIYVVFFVLYLLKDSVGAINDLLTQFVTEDSLTNKLLIANLDNIKEYFMQFFNMIIGAVSSSAAL